MLLVLRVPDLSSSSCCLYEERTIHGVSITPILSFLSLVWHLSVRHVLVSYLDGAVHKAPSQLATLNEGV